MQEIALARRFMESRGASLQAVALVLLMVSVPLFYMGGMTQGRLAQERADQGRVELEQKIITLIVERNPQATIREFASFPRTLLEVSQAADIDFRIVLAIADKESQFNPGAIGKSGEIGLMQLMPSTAELVVKRLGLEYTPPEIGKNGTYASLGSLADPKFNIRVGTAYLRWQINRYGFNATALRAYNRNPDKATENRPADRYAEDVSFRYLAFAHALR
jgi:soluble lytic murein transglycosylase-like protein